MTLRNRELLNLLGVGALTATGFASVYISRQEVVSTASLSTRPSSSRSSSRRTWCCGSRSRTPTVPAAPGRPADRDRPHDDLPHRARPGLPSGSLGRHRPRGLRGARLPRPRLPLARQHQVHPRNRRHRPARPAGGSGARQDDQRGVALGRVRRRGLPAGRVRKGAPGRLPGRLPARQPRAPLNGQRSATGSRHRSISGL